VGDGVGGGVIIGLFDMTLLTAGKHAISDRKYINLITGLR